VSIEALFIETMRRERPVCGAACRAMAWQRETLSPGEGFAGSLDVIDLAEVTQAIALGRKTGRLQSLAASAATILDNGRVVPPITGRVEPAFAAIIPHPSEPDARFRAAWTTPTFRPNRRRSPRMNWCPRYRRRHRRGRREMAHFERVAPAAQTEPGS
jgi:hypothetical protein